MIHQGALTSVAHAGIRDYAARQWRSMPGVRVLFDANFGVTESGLAVSAWEDRVLGEVAAQAAPANQPTYVPNWRGSNAAIRGGATLNLANAGFGIGLIPQPVALFIVGEGDSTFDSQRLHDGGDGVNRLIFNTTTFAQAFAGSFGGTIPKPVGPFVVTEFYDNPSSEYAIEALGGELASQNVSVGTNGLNGITILGSGASFSWLGHVAFVAIVDHIPPPSLATQARGILKRRYAINSPYSA
jgi:hypothetical protein